MPPGIRTPRAPAQNEDELDDQILDAEPDEAEELMRAREVGRARQSDRYAATNNATGWNDLLKVSPLPLQVANIPITASALTTGQKIREAAAADRQALSIEELLAATKQLHTSDARDAAATALAGSEKNAANAALRSAAVRSQIPDDLQGMSGDVGAAALPGEDTQPMARAMPPDPSAVDDFVEPSTPYGRGFGQVDVPKESAGITPHFERHRQPIPGKGMVEPVNPGDPAIPVQEIDSLSGKQILGRAPAQAPLPADAPTPSRLAALKKEWREAIANEYGTVRDLVKNANTYRQAEAALEATGRTGEQIRGYVYPRAAQAAEQAMHTAKTVGSTATKFGKLAEPLAAAAVVPIAIAERMAKYGDFGENVRHLAYLNGEPVNRMSAAAESKLAQDRDLLGRLWQEGAVSDELAERLLGDDLEFEKPEEEVLLAQREP